MSPRAFPLLLVVVVAAGCGSTAARSTTQSSRGAGSPSARTTSAAAPTWPAKPAATKFVRIDHAHRTVDLTLIAADGMSNNGFNFDDYSRGELIVSVPVGWHVSVRCKNDAPVQASCAVVSGSLATTPAFRGASVPNPVAGLASGSSATFSFLASRPGSFRLTSLVPGQEQARMWDVLEVTRGGRPGVLGRPGP